MAPPRLRHLHLPSAHPHYIPYSLASRVQEHLRRQHLDFKDLSSTTATQRPPPPPPPPTLLSFTPSPIYTLGRRQTIPLTTAEVSRLTAPLQTPPPKRYQGTREDDGDGDAVCIRPELLHSPRGGLTTYHGPGQVVLWPVLDLKSRHHKNFTVKCYARLLEDTTISVLARVFNLEAFTTGDPGVWVRHTSPSTTPSDQVSEGGGDGAGAGGEISKIAALGVHLRRHITALGTAINIAMPGPEVSDEGVNPWARIVACGLEGRGVTCVAAEVKGGVGAVDEILLTEGRRGLDGDGLLSREAAVAGAWAEELARRIGIEGGVERVGQEESVRLMERLVEEAGGEPNESEREYLEQMRAVARGG